jgi:hypothetical protein
MVLYATMPIRTTLLVLLCFWLVVGMGEAGWGLAIYLVAVEDG